MSRADRMDFMRTSVSFNYDPHTTSVEVLPGLELDTVDIVALEYCLEPRLGRCLESRILNRCIAPVTELAVIACAAERAGNSQHGRDLSVQFRVWARTAFVNIDTPLKARQGVVQDHRVGPVVGHQIGKIPTRCWACLKAAIVPAGIQI